MARQDSGVLSALPNPRFTRVNRFDGRNVVRFAAWVLAPQLAILLALLAATEGLGIEVSRHLDAIGLGVIEEWMGRVMLLTLIACAILLPTVLVRRRPAVVLELEVDGDWTEIEYWLNAVDSPGLETLVDEMDRRADLTGE